jgi:outer membrane protein TolC
MTWLLIVGSLRAPHMIVMTAQRVTRVVKVCVLLVIFAGAASAQDLRSYIKPASHLPNLIGPYQPHSLPAPKLSNSARMDQLLQDGKLVLSLSDAISLALENNLDIAIARYNLAIADTDILRSKAGAQVRGVATGLVQGTPGGGIGGFGAGAPGAGAGGTSGGAGGAGTGASGLVQSTLGAGSNVDSYDPQLNATLNINHSVLPLSNIVTTGVAGFAQNSGIANFSYSQAFATGTRMMVDFENSRTTNNSLFSTLVPELRSNFRLTIRQRLLSGFGIGPNVRFIRIARNNREISDIAFRNQVIATVSQIQNIYWDLVNASEDVRVKERSLSLAEKTLSDNKQQVKIGTLPPIEVVKAESEVANRSEELILAQTNLQLQSLLMKNAITRNLNDPVLGAATVVPSDTMRVPEQEPVTPVQDLVSDALAHRAEVAQARIDLTNRGISRKAAANVLLPSVDLIAWYGASGLAGLQNPTNPDLAPGAVPRTGFNNAFSRLFGNDFPDYAVGLNINIPLRNRAAQADQIRSELEYRQAEMRLQQLQNQIAIEVRNAQFTVQQNRARVEAARKARNLAEHTFDIEQKKFLLGASTSISVLQAQRDLGVAESSLVAAMSAYEKSRVELDRATGLTLTHNNIELQDAEQGQVRRSPQIPGVVPR